MSQDTDLLQKIYDTLSKQGGSKPSYTPVSTGIDAIDNASKKVNSFTSSLDSVLKEWEYATTSFGINWNNDAIGLTTSISKSRMSIEEWSESIKFAKTGFTSLGGTMNESARVFTSIATNFRDSGASEAMAKMAWTTGEQNKLLAYSMVTNRNLDLSRIENQNKLFDSMVKLGQEMDKTSQLTGMSRQQQMNQMEENKNDMRFQANKRVLDLQGYSIGAKAIENFASTSGSLNSLIKNFSQGGVLTDENRQKAQAIGPDLAEKLRIAVQQLQHSRTKEEETANLQRLDVIKDEIKVRAGSIEFMKDASVGESDVAEARRKLLSDNGNALLNSVDGMTTKANELGISTREATKVLNAQISKSLESTDATGKQYAGAETTEGLVKSRRALEDMVKVPMDVIQKTNERIGKSVSAPGVDNLSVNDRLSTIDKKTGEVMSDKIYGDFGKQLTNSISNGTFLKDFGSSLEKAAIQGLSNIKSIAAGTIQLSGNLISGSGISTGSKEDYGNWIGKNLKNNEENILHSEDYDISKYKTPEFLKDMQKSIGGQQSNIVDNMINTMNVSAAEIAKNTPQPVIDTNKSQSQSGNESPGLTTNDVSLKDINEQLTTLNTSIAKLVSTNTEILDISDKQYYATKQLSPNLNIR